MIYLALIVAAACEPSPTMIVVGDSTAWRMASEGREALDVLREDYQVYVYGFPGATTGQIASYCEAWNLNDDADLVVLLSGYNDRDALGGLAVLDIQRFFDTDKFIHIDNKSDDWPSGRIDKVHLTPEGYKSLVETILRRIEIGAPNA